MRIKRVLIAASVVAMTAAVGGLSVPPSFADTPSCADQIKTVQTKVNAMTNATSKAKAQKELDAATAAQDDATCKTHLKNAGHIAHVKVK
jgi:hypothetical protein